MNPVGCYRGLTQCRKWSSICSVGVKLHLVQNIPDEAPKRASESVNCVYIISDCCVSFCAVCTAEIFFFVCVCLQERQRLETILNLCSEYNKSDPSVGVDTGRACQFPGMGEVSVWRHGPDPASVLTQSSHRQRESEEENLKEECSSTESQHQEVQHTHTHAHKLSEILPLLD